jgi:hypothetical protein
MNWDYERFLGFKPIYLDSITCMAETSIEDLPRTLDKM